MSNTDLKTQKLTSNQHAVMTSLITGQHTYQTVDLSSLANAAGVSLQAARNSLISLSNKGLISYESKGGNKPPEVNL